MKITQGRAREITDRIKNSLCSLDEDIHFAVANEVWLELGYAGMSDWWAGEGLDAYRLSKASQRLAIERLREEGLPERGIAETLGVPKSTVHRALKPTSKIDFAPNGAGVVTPATESKPPQTTVEGTLEKSAGDTGVFTEGSFVERFPDPVDPAAVRAARHEFFRGQCRELVDEQQALRTKIVVWKAAMAGEGFAYEGNAVVDLQAK